MHKAKHHHAVSGFFVVISGVIGLTSIVSTLQVVAITSQNTEVAPSAVVEIVDEASEPVRAPFTFEIAPAGHQTIIENYPAEVNQPITYLSIESQSDEALELFDIDLDLQTNIPYKGAVTLSHGDAESTIGLRVADTERSSTVNIPVVRGIVLPPYSSIVVAIAADGIPAIGDQLYEGLTFDLSITSVGWRVVAAQDNQIMRAPVEFSVPAVLFRPVR